MPRYTTQDIETGFNGSEEIKRMRATLDFYARLLRDSLKPEEVEAGGRTIVHQNEPSLFCWGLSLHRDKKRIEVHCSFDDGSGGLRVAYTTGENTVSLGHVQAVYDTLPVFLASAVGLFPKFEHRLAPFMAAGRKVAAKQG